jgi:hypothetical protein
MTKLSRPTPDYEGLAAWAKAEAARQVAAGEADNWMLHAVASDAADCECYHTCAEDPDEACSLSGEWHVHPGEPCPVHPDAPGDH